MKKIDVDTVREAVDASPRLQQLAAQLRDELGVRFAAAGVSPDQAMLDPITILMLISVILQVIRLCRERNQRSAEDIAADLRTGPRVPPQRTMRLRRRLNTLWRDYRTQHNLPATEINPFISAVYAVSGAIDATTVNEFVALTNRR